MKRLTIQDVKKMGSDNLSVFGGTFEGGINLQQIPDEIVPCLNVINSKIKNILEIGSAAGGMAWLFNHVFEPDNIIIIDDNTHPKHVLRKSILKDLKNITEIIGESSKVVTSVKALKMEFDIILIDGGHSYKEVASDVKDYMPFLNDNGYLLLHDVKIFDYIEIIFEELKKDFQWSKKYISETHTNPCGIGVLRK